MIDEILRECPWHPEPTRHKLDAHFRFINTIWGEIELKPPKLIVALSLTSSYDRTPPKNLAVFPAILDTGFNRTLEIDERQLFHKSINAKWVRRLPIDTVVMDEKGKRRDTYASQVHIWLHRYPYDYKGKRSSNSPVLLGESKRMRVVVPPNLGGDADPQPWPPMPLLGLEAIKANALQLVLDGKSHAFSLNRHRD